ncbi:uncharacterized protein EV154DRAFT_603237 [Mucor mucedo]|uniref:NADH:flavin oxidoreductase/NADH oxidase N-terminal domain-containing protein n=1 Tax=Mucor saturninus TaxID=64648 RepID=A0A8H7UX94_9FUNG|nr:uncharacterized protein EV154DRAFT_603237 [Mucor mucedo]KAG2202026.1 hypothetical protein INT47_006218 [Mucor saturninus]KAI7890380.1 hypothetical protein EV154DRAFT_603237 [Mucor mucedo]
MSTTRALFSPIKVGNNNLQHRVVLAPLTRLRADLDGVPTDLQVEYYKQRASEGGLMITEGTFIHRLAGNYKHAPGIYTQAQIEGWKKITSAVHEKKAVIFTQLWHVGRAGSNAFNPNGEQVVSASALPLHGTNTFGPEYDVPRALEIDEIKVIVQQYRQAALNAIEAGFDGVEVHSASGYLLDQFINTSSNHRTDIYGGSIENRARFALEVIDAIVQAIGPERTAIRLSPGEVFQEMHDDTEVETWSHITSELQKNHPQLAYLHFNQARSNIWGEHNRVPLNTLDPYRKIWKGPIITASGFTTALEAAFDLAESTGNMIAFGRGFIANPDLPERLRHGWKLNPYDRSTFYAQGPVGYTDYPFYDAAKN